MRIYISNGRVYAAFDETIEICKHEPLDTLQKYKDDLLEKVSKRFDWTVTEAALNGMKEDLEKHEESSESVAEPQETVSELQETVSESRESETKELFRAPKDGAKHTEGKKTRQRIDYGKIMALHNAGWSNAKIADEMGMTYAAVATAISTYKKKMRVGGGKA